MMSFMFVLLEKMCRKDMCTRVALILASNLGVCAASVDSTICAQQHLVVLSSTIPTVVL